MFGNKILIICAEISAKAFERNPCSPFEPKTLGQTTATAFSNSSHILKLRYAVSNRYFY
jgi:hypothetical protein